MYNKSLSLVLTTYNEEENVTNTLKEINKFKDIDLEVIIVDDNSTDNTLNKILELKLDFVKVISRKKTKGLASAIIRGLFESTKDNICWIDVDMTNQINKLQIMLQNIESNDIVILSRYVKEGGDKRNLIRRLSSRLINIYSRLILGFAIKDYTGGIFLIKREVLNCVLPIPYGHGEYFPEFLYNLKRKNCKIVELPFVQEDRKYGDSKSYINIFNFLYTGYKYAIRILLARLNRE